MFTLSYKVSVSMRDPITPKSMVNIDSIEASFLTFQNFVHMNSEKKAWLDSIFKESLEGHLTSEYSVEQEALSSAYLSLLIVS